MTSLYLNRIYCVKVIFYLFVKDLFIIVFEQEYSINIFFYIFWGLVITQNDTYQTVESQTCKYCANNSSHVWSACARRISHVSRVCHRWRDRHFLTKHMFYQRFSFVLQFRLFINYWYCMVGSDWFHFVLFFNWLQRVFLPTRIK